MQTLFQKAQRLNAIYKLVREHGFRAEVSDVVKVWIPYTAHNGMPGGEDCFTVRTMAEARIVLGY